MAQYDFQITDYDRIFRKQWRIVLATAIIGLVMAVMFARTKVPVYHSTATVKVDRTSMGGGLGADMGFYGTWDNIETQTKVITSYPVLFRAAKNLKMIAENAPEDIHPSDERILTLFEGLRGQIATSVATSTNIISVTTTSTNPVQARDLANAIAFAYKDYTMYCKKLNASQTRLFIDQQLEQSRIDLTAAEDAVRVYEENQRIPSISVHTQETIGESEKLRDKLESINQGIATMTEQAQKLQSPDGLSRMARDAMQPGDTLKAGPGALKWISEFTDNDQGLSMLNGRLIQLQLELDDQKTYYKGDHPAVRNTQKKINETMSQILAEYQNKIALLRSKRKAMELQMDTVEAGVRLLPTNEMEYSRLQRKVRIKESLNSMLQSRLQEARIAEAGVVDDVTVMSIATVPRSASEQSMARMAFIGLFLGFIFGIIFAIIREMFDTSIGTIEDVERTLKIAVLAVIPHIHLDDAKPKKGILKRKQPVKKSNGSRVEHSPLRSVLVTHFAPKDPTAEAYRILRTNIGYLSINKPLKCILLTSATMQEGKSTTISNLAIAFAQQGKRVVLVECNLRRPSQQRVFGVDHHSGVADILIDKANWRDCVMTVTDLALGDFAMDEILTVPGLDKFNLIPYGHRPPNPAELLSSERMDTFLSELKEAYDIVLVDGPPVLPVADSIVLSTKVEGVILIYKVGKAPRNSLRLCKERLDAVHANVLGVVLNDIRPEISGGLSYSSYVYTYGRSEDFRKRKLRFFFWT